MRMNTSDRCHALVESASFIAARRTRQVDVRLPVQKHPGGRHLIWRGGGEMFERYIFEDPLDESHQVKVCGWSYLAAGLTGSVYVLCKVGRMGFLFALLPNFFLTGLLVALTGLTSFALSGSQQLIALTLAVPIILAFQSVQMIKIVKKIFMGRGWSIHSAD